MKLNESKLVERKMYLCVVCNYWCLIRTKTKMPRQRLLSSQRRKRRSSNDGVHRAYVTKITKVSTHCAKADPDETDRVPLAGYEVSVQLKLDTLSLLDDEIIELISEEDEIEKEIVHSARYSATSKEHWSTSNWSFDPSFQMPMYRWHLHHQQLRNRSQNIRNWAFNPSTVIPSSSNRSGIVSVRPWIKQIWRLLSSSHIWKGTWHPARAAVDGISLLEANYDGAVQILHDRFGNKQLLISTNMGKLINLPSFSANDSVDKLRDMYNKIETCIRNLKTLKVTIDQYGSVLVSLVMLKIPDDVCLVITRVVPLNEEWDTEKFLYIFRKEVESRELCEQLYKNSRKDGDYITPNRNLFLNSIFHYTGKITNVHLLKVGISQFTMDISHFSGVIWLPILRIYSSFQTPQSNGDFISNFVWSNQMEYMTKHCWGLSANFQMNITL